MQLLQSLAELQTQGDVQISFDDLPKALEYYGARIGRDLGRLHKLTDGKITVGFIVEMATFYEHLELTDPENIPSKTPAEIFKEDLIPYMESSELIVEAINDDDSITATN